MTKLFTIGYSGQSLSDFGSLLVDNAVEVLVDVREIPISRKKGFSKSALSEFLREIGITYVHVRDLGSPRDLRNNVRESHDYERFFSSLRHLYAEPRFTEPFGMIAKESKIHRVCLMCCCSDWKLCHRRILCEQLESMVDKICHLPMSTTRRLVA